jgi:hypothetical protein
MSDKYKKPMPLPKPKPKRGTLNEMKSAGDTAAIRAAVKRADAEAKRKEQLAKQKKEEERQRKLAAEARLKAPRGNLLRTPSGLQSSDDVHKSLKERMKKYKKKN